MRPAKSVTVSTLPRSKPVSATPITWPTPVNPRVFQTESTPARPTVTSLTSRGDAECSTQRTPGKDGEFDTPSLIELYRTAPYLHDGRAATLMQVLSDFNKKDEHGVTSDLTEQQLRDLEAFLMTL